VSQEMDQVIRVLFVEDAFEQALLVRAFLQDVPGDFQVTHSQDGDHAAQLLRERRWELLITDLNLPGIDGFELCRIARSAHPTLPILAITGYTGAHYQEEAYRAGAAELLIKPLEKDDFVRKVVELTGHGGSDTTAAPPGPGGAAPATGEGDAAPEAPAATTPSTRNTVLAVGGLLGDVEMGCGGTLLRHRQEGAEVVIVPLWDEDLDDASVSAAHDAAGQLGARLVLDVSSMADTDQRSARLRRLVQELTPRIAFVPALDDGHVGRREAFRIGIAQLDSVPLVLGYQTATTGTEFRPARFEDVGEVLMDKMEALTAFQAAGTTRLDLAPRMAQAYARYWGRFRGFVEVEAFEVVRG